MGLIGGGASGFPDGRVAQAASRAEHAQARPHRRAASDQRPRAVRLRQDRRGAQHDGHARRDLDPNADPILQAIFPGTELANGDFRKAAAAMKIVINGYGGAGTIEYGGRDYHQNPRPDTDNKDFIVGQVDRRRARVRGAAQQAADDLRLQRRLRVGQHELAGGRRQRHRESSAGSRTTRRRPRASSSSTARSAGRCCATAPRRSSSARSARTAASTRPSSPFANSVTTARRARGAELSRAARRGSAVRHGAHQSEPRHGRGGGAVHRVQSNRLTAKTHERRRAIAPTPRAAMLAALAPSAGVPVVPQRARRSSRCAARACCAGNAAAVSALQERCGAIPWLFRDPDGALLEWRARFNSYLHASTLRASATAGSAGRPALQQDRGRTHRAHSQGEGNAAAADIRAARPA